MEAGHDIIDIGVNLTHRSFHGDRQAVVQRAFEAGIRTMVHGRRRNENRLR